MPQKINVRDVFKPLGVPTTTYVRREDGKYEKELAGALDAKGKLCLLTGPSKTGKTTLYTRTLQDKGLEPIIVRCDASMTSDDFWKRALEKINFDRLSTVQNSASTKTSGSGKIGGTIGWKWLAGLLGEVSIGVEQTMGEIQIREKILSKPSPDHLVPVLKYLPTVLVVEDFHYLDATTKKTVFQQWKVFVDGEVSVIVVGTTHHAVDLAYANSDLVGRIAQVDLSMWSNDDLERIATLGFGVLKLTATSLITHTIAHESAGLPILVQETCGQLLADKGIVEIEPGMITLAFELTDVYTALHEVAKTHYGQFESHYERLITGPRKAARKFDTYELVLSAFAKDPLAFSLKRYEIDERLSAIPISKDKIPPPASINATLRALAKFQERNGFNLLEWNEQAQRLYIIEPAFLFYLRWREKRDKPLPWKEFLINVLGLLK